MCSTERAGDSGSFRPIAPRASRGLFNHQSSTDLFQRPPRKLDKEKCDNCRQAKQKCIEKGSGCQRCFQRSLTCSGRYKASSNSSLSTTTTTVTSEADNVTASPAARPEWQQATPEEGLSSTPDSEAGFQQYPHVQSHESKVEDLTGEDVDQDVRDALDELRGLNIGLDMADTIDDEQEVEPFAPDIGVPASVDSDQLLPRSNMDKLQEVFIYKDLFRKYGYQPPWLPRSDSDKLYEALIEEHGYQPSSSQLFMNYLRSLEPSDSGLVKCTSCHSEPEDFQFEDIGRHFQTYHCFDLWYELDLLPSFDMVSIGVEPGFETKQRLYALLDACMAKQREHSRRQQGLRVEPPLNLPPRRQSLRVEPKPNLPSVLVLLSELRIVCDGRLACISPRCSLEPFEPTWDALREHYEGTHANAIIKTDPSRVFEIGNHLKKHEYSIARKLKKAAAIRVAWFSTNTGPSEVKLMADLARIACEASTYRRIAQTQQWRLVRDLNRLFRTRYKQFVLDTTRSSSAELGVFADDLGSTLPSAKRLRRLATKTFEKVLLGNLPNTFLEVLAFGMLSESMTTVMQQQGVPCLSSPTLADHLAWANCIQDQQERQSYDFFVLDWFKRNSSMSLDQPPLYQGTEAIWGAEHDILIRENMKRHVLNLMGTRPSGYSSNFSAFLKFDIFADRTTGKKKPETVDQGNEVTATPQKCNLDETPTPNVNVKVKYQLMTLRTNVIFVRVYLFMIYITDQGVLLIYLGNQERQCRMFSWGNHTATAYSILRTTEEMKTIVIDPLLRDAQQWDCCASKIFKAAETMLDFGQVWRLEELHRQMVMEVERSVEESTLRCFLLNRITQQCFDACGLVKPACENYNTCSVCQCTTLIS